MDRRIVEDSISKAEVALDQCKQAMSHDDVAELKTWLAELAKYAVDGLKWL